MLGKLTRGTNTRVAAIGAAALTRSVQPSGGALAVPTRPVPTRPVPLPAPPPKRVPLDRPTPRVAMLPSLDFELDVCVDTECDTANVVPLRPCAANETAPPEPPTRPALPADTGAPRAALSSGEATVIVAPSADDVARLEAQVIARIEAQVLAAVRAALAGVAPRKPALDVGAALRWMLAGTILGAVVVYVLMASALHREQLRVAQATTPPTVFVPQAAPPVVTRDAPLSCPASIADVIPSVDVSVLPKVKPTPRFAPRPRATAEATESKVESTVDESNPYDGVATGGDTAGEPTL